MVILCQGRPIYISIAVSLSKMRSEEHQALIEPLASISNCTQSPSRVQNLGVDIFRRQPEIFNAIYIHTGHFKQETWYTIAQSLVATTAGKAPEIPSDASTTPKGISPHSITDPSHLSLPVSKMRSKSHRHLNREINPRSRNVIVVMCELVEVCGMKSGSTMKRNRCRLSPDGDFIRPFQASLQRQNSYRRNGQKELLGPGHLGRPPFLPISTIYPPFGHPLSLVLNRRVDERTHFARDRVRELFLILSLW
jgi:hypothetical protein